MRRVPPAIALAASAVLAAGCGTVRVPRPYPGAPIVREIRIVGAHELAPETILARLGTVATGRWPWDARRWFDPVVWADDLVRIPRIYRAEGFYDARVVAHAVKEVQGGVVLTAEVDEGPRTRLAEVEVRGLDALPPDVRRRARGAVSLRAGHPFREAAFQGSQGAVLDALRSAGYATAEVHGEARVVPGERVARALLEVTPGPRFRFGPIRVLPPLPPGVSADDVVAEARLVLPQDAWHDPAALTEAEARLFRMGAFSAVQVSDGTPDPDTGRVPIDVAVRTGATRTVAVGAGVGLSPSRDDVHVRAEAALRPPGGAVRALRLTAIGGYALVPPLSSTFHLPPRRGPFARVIGDADVPRAFGVPGLHLVASTELELAIDEAYRATAVYPAAGLAWDPAPAIQVLGRYRFTGARLFDTPLGTDPAAPASFGCAAPCTTSGLELRVAWDTHRLSDPRSGGQAARIRLLSTGGWLGGGYDLVQAFVEIAADRPLGPATSIAARADGGTALSTGDLPVPVLDRLAGGGATMRGYGAGRLSPVMAATVGGTVTAVPVRGRGLLEASLELRHRLGDRFAGLAFVDACAASIGPFDPGTLLGALTLAIGAGLRLTTPLGSVGVDLAWRPPIGPPLPVVQAPGGSSAVAPVGCFGLGGGRARGGGPYSPCSIHISIGGGP